MMKEDKMFIKDLIVDLKSGLESQMTNLKTDIESQIRHNGVLIEDVKDSIDSLHEGQEITNHRLGNLEKDIKEVKVVISDYPIFCETVKKHSRQLAGLTK